MKTAEELQSEIDQANAQLAALTAASSAPVAPVAADTANEDELIIRQKMAHGFTRQQASEIIERQRHFDTHVAPHRARFAAQGRAVPFVQRRP